MFDIFLPKYVKRGKHILQGVKKFLDYNRDLMTPESLAAVITARDSYKAVLETRNAQNLAAEEKSLTKVCEKALPNYKMDPIRENVEVIIVAVLVALGIRAYFLQPFKIPTSSMQPTLNGLIGTAMPGSEPFPNPVKQGWDFVWGGINYTELKAPTGTGLRITSVQQKSVAGFFTRTIVGFSDGSSSTCYCPAKQLFSDLWIAGRPLGMLPVEDFPLKQMNMPVPSGAVLARGALQTGDQLLVDKMSYHFSKPTRGEVFVFHTKDVPVPSVRKDEKGNVLTSHYIKRLGGLPGDKLMIVDPHLYVNGKIAEDSGFQKVMKAEENPELNPHINKLHGYLEGPVDPSGKKMRQYEPGPDNIKTERVDFEGKSRVVFQVGEHEYFALGDNSGHSSDSRDWGKVPERNLVGRALIVYWPFAPHWGLIR
jgi:signal peptidase I